MAARTIRPVPTMVGMAAGTAAVTEAMAATDTAAMVVVTGDMEEGIIVPRFTARTLESELDLVADTVVMVATAATAAMVTTITTAIVGKSEVNWQ
jgi:hypothetical protein